MRVSTIVALTVAAGTALVFGCDRQTAPTEPSLEPQFSLPTTSHGTGPPLAPPGPVRGPVPPGPPPHVPGADRAPYPTPVVAAGGGGVGAFSCALRRGLAFCWGLNDRGQLGNGTLEDSSLPVAVLSAQRFVTLVAGEFHACGLGRDGSAWCWGFNGSGQLGVPRESEGGISFSSTPVPVEGGLSFRSLDAGYAHTCGITDGDLTYCWGYGTSGQLGDGQQTTSSTPVPVAGGLTFTSVSGGLVHTCGVTTAGEAYCWGRDLGRPWADSPVPIPAADGMTLVSIHAGTGINCGLTPNREAYCWGMEYGDGSLGLGVVQGRALGFPLIEEPTPVVGDLHFKSLVVTKNNVWQGHTCGLTQSGEAYCWGSNASGAVGAPTPHEICDGVYQRDFLCSSSPLPVSGNERFVALSVGSAYPNQNHTCAATRSGEIYCWGANESGQLGAPSTETCAVPGVGDIACSTKPVRVIFPHGHPPSP